MNARCVNARYAALLFFVVGLWPALAPAAELFPVPPQQYAPWKAPNTKLPAKIVNAARNLFVLGLADPRGGEYREITVTTGDVWGRESEVATHGWVLPQTNFAIAWNGLIYPLKSMGERVNLRDDLFNLPPFEIRQAINETASIRCPPRSLIGVCLLLRLGESAAAENLWRAAQLSPLATSKTRVAPSEELASHWAWALWNRALCAHLRGADEVALRDARQMKHLQPFIEAKVTADRRNNKNKTPFHLNFLGQLRRLASDQERRAKEEKLNAADTQKNPDKDIEIAALISNLENVSARQWGQPGGVDLTTSPVVQELIARDEEAIPALLQAMAQDYRLTRAVSFHRDYFTSRHIITTAEAAYAALQKISGQSFGSATDLDKGGSQRVALLKRARAALQTPPQTSATIAPTSVVKAPLPLKTAANYALLAQQLRKTSDELTAKNQPLQDFDFLEPLWTYPSAAPLAKVAADLFNGKNSLWNPLIDPRRAAQWNAAVAGPLLSVPSYRAQVARQLKNWAKCGTIETLAGAKVLIRTPNDKAEENLVRAADAPPLGAKNDFRVCDFYAWQLSKIAGAPRCELFWDFEKRDRAVSDVGDWLQAYGAFLHPAPGGVLISSSLPAQLVFLPLKTAATPNDVKAHKAIFSLQDLGNVRLTSLKLPVYAIWKNQGVTIWQAEEVQVGAQWRRHYGIVAPHEIRRVAASEIQLVKEK